MLKSELRNLIYAYVKGASIIYAPVPTLEDLQLPEEA